MARRAWETPFSATKPVFVAVVGLVTLGMVAVLVGAAVREHREPAFRPDWVVWAPVTIGIGVGLVFGHDSGLAVSYLPLGAVWCATGLAQLRRRVRMMARAAELGVVRPSCVRTPNSNVNSRGA